MARRMFSDEVTDTDAFLDMPIGSQLLYFKLGMKADDDGFIGNPRAVMRAINASEDDIKILYAKKFLLSFDGGICVIKHWRINNQLRKDRYRETKYIHIKALLRVERNGSYTLNPQKGIPMPMGYFLPSGNHPATVGRRSIGKVSIGKVSNSDIDHIRAHKKMLAQEAEDVEREQNELGNKKFQTITKQKKELINKFKIKT